MASQNKPKTYKYKVIAFKPNSTWSTIVAHVIRVQILKHMDSDGSKNTDQTKKKLKKRRKRGGQAHRESR